MELRCLDRSPLYFIVWARAKFFLSRLVVWTNTAIHTGTAPFVKLCICPSISLNYTLSRFQVVIGFMSNLMGPISVVYCGHLGTAELDGVAIANTVSNQRFHPEDYFLHENIGNSRIDLWIREIPNFPISLFCESQNFPNSCLVKGVSAMKFLRFSGNLETLRVINAPFSELPGRWERPVARRIRRRLKLSVLALIFSGNQRNGHLHSGGPLYSLWYTICSGDLTLSTHIYIDILLRFAG